MCEVCVVILKGLWLSLLTRPRGSLGALEMIRSEFGKNGYKAELSLRDKNNSSKYAVKTAIQRLAFCRVTE